MSHLKVYTPPVETPTPRYRYRTPKKKATKAEVVEVYDTLSYWLNDFSGKTPSEMAREFDSRLDMLRQKAAKLNALMRNANVYAKRSWQWERCVEMDSRIQSFEDRYKKYRPAA